MSDQDGINRGGPVAAHNGQMIHAAMEYVQSRYGRPGPTYDFLIFPDGTLADMRDMNASHRGQTYRPAAVSTGDTWNGTDPFHHIPTDESDPIADIISRIGRGAAMSAHSTDRHRSGDIEGSRMVSYPPVVTGPENAEHDRRFR